MNDLTIKDFIAKPIHHSKIEFWAATTIFVFALFSLTTGNSPNEYNFRREGVVYEYYQHYFFPQLIRYTWLYLTFLLLNFVVTPKLIRKEGLVLNLFLLTAAFLLLGTVLGTIDTYYKAYLIKAYWPIDLTYSNIFRDSFRHAFWLLLMFSLYTVIKYTALYILTNAATIESKFSMITRDALSAFIVWMVGVFLLFIVGADVVVVVVCGTIALSGIALYCYSFYSLIPASLGKKRPFGVYLLKTALVLVVSVLPIGLLVFLLVHEGDTAFATTMMNIGFQLLITAPLSWVLFKRHLKGKEEVYVLKRELGRSTANLDFLRSQINPHFLFNALNTLYGTALQENSERTAQGIQMLGDMMRFMLHENHQPRILLSRETEYMRNYIDLQLLRTSNSPDIVVQTKIQEVLEERFIAPMLLIPFVENAFKHGISLKNKSWIRITLHCQEDKLFFDVYNSTHPKQEQDPEKDKSGIGLVNVKQRLTLLYPDRHELTIRETAGEFFVHLTLQLR